MVDVVLVILIFFMASTTFLGPEWLLRAALLRPATDAGASDASGFILPPARFELTLTTDPAGSTRVRGLGLESATIDHTLERLTEYAARLGPENLTIVVSPEASVPYRDVIRIHEACASLGIEGVGLN